MNEITCPGVIIMKLCACDIFEITKNIPAVSDVLIYNKVAVFYSQKWPLFKKYEILCQYVYNIGYLL